MKQTINASSILENSPLKSTQKDYNLCNQISQNSENIKNTKRYDLLPQTKRNSEVYCIGLLGSGKSTIINYLKHGDLKVIKKGHKYILDVSEEQKKSLEGECVIVHSLFVQYVGPIKETIKINEDNLFLHEMHLNIREKISDQEFEELLGEQEYNFLDNKHFQIVISGFEVENKQFSKYLLFYILKIHEIIEKIIRKTSGRCNYEEILSRFEIIISKAHISEDRNSMRLKLEKTKEDLTNICFDESARDYSTKILDFFINQIEKIFFLFRVQREGSFLEIINE